ncbi:hypothetical protein L1987_09324 [Smallanthus sonchifolius]|uniref:Uncharacterized protein n=1 Tax=Smallanthus sonchifolius TaxID=185202 RepID=A0ACB9JN27_9ASTR|nr:hypothetical protein L1987_09324 [Smallanthus sonchifolius]
MGRAPCCEKEGIKKGRWTAEEDETLIKYIQANGEGSWRSLPKNAVYTLYIVNDDRKIGQWESTRFFRGKNNLTLTSMDMTNIIQTSRRRTGRVSRRVAKKYNKNKLDDHIKSSSSSTSNESALQAVNTDRVSCGVKLILEEERGNEEPGPDEELMNINKFLVSGATDSDAFFGLHDEGQTGSIIANTSVECAKTNLGEDESFMILNSPISLGFCSYGDDMEFGFEEVGDDMNVWQWGDDDLELNQYQYHY